MQVFVILRLLKAIKGQSPLEREAAEVDSSKTFPVQPLVCRSIPKSETALSTICQKIPKLTEET